MTGTSVKVKFRPSIVTGKEGSLYYQVIHKRNIRQINTEYKIHPSEWDSRSESVLLSPYDNERSSVLQAIQERIRWDKVLLGRIVASLNENGLEYTTDDVVQLFHDKAKEQSFFNFMQGVSIRLKRLGKVRTSETYATTLKNFMDFRNGKDIIFDEISHDMMMEYEMHLRQKGLALNTISTRWRNYTLSGIRMCIFRIYDLKV